MVRKLRAAFYFYAVVVWMNPRPIAAISAQPTARACSGITGDSTESVFRPSFLEAPEACVWPGLAILLAAEGLRSELGRGSQARQFTSEWVITGIRPSHFSANRDWNP